MDIGLDISTSVIGVCVLNAGNGEMISLTHIELKSTKFEDIYEKVDEARTVLKALISSNPNWRLRNIAVEEFAKQFSAGFSSADTLFTLAKFNHAICQFIYDTYQIKPVKVNVRTMRSVLGINIDFKDKSKTTKQKVFDLVKEKNPEFPWLTHVAKNGKSKGQIVYDKQNEDMADSWVVARGNWNSINNILKPTKTKTKK